MDLTVIQKFNINQITDVFFKEFGCIADKFCIIQAPTNETVHFLKANELTKGKAWEQKVADTTFVNNTICKPGVYVLWKPDSDSGNVIKVGRHLTNSRMRAFQHITMKDHYVGFDTRTLSNDNDARVLLFNVKDEADKHWVAAVEIFLEEKLAPLVSAKRKG